MARLPKVEALPWPRFQEWFAEAWEPGQHVATIAPTGTGKTVLNLGLLKSRRYVLAFDPKGGDGTLRGAGFPRLVAWPPSKEDYKAMAEGRPVRYMVGPVIKVVEDFGAQIKAHAAALDGAFADGGWTIYVDELQLLADRRFMGLTAPIERLLISARDKGISVVTTYQRPANVPRTASDQASWVFVSRTRDIDVINRLAEMLGRPKAELRGVMAGLGGSNGKYSWLVVGRDPFEPFRFTKPELIRPVREPS